jgi:hypothetical protein
MSVYLLLAIGESVSKVGYVYDDHRESWKYNIGGRSGCGSDNITEKNRNLAYNKPLTYRAHTQGKNPLPIKPRDWGIRRYVISCVTTPELSKNYCIFTTGVI